MQFDQLGRRQFMAFLSSAAVACPLAAFAQQPSMPAIGYLSARTPEDSVEVLADFHRGLAETGFVAGQNVAIEYRWLEGHYDRLQEMVADLVRRRVAVTAKRLELLHELVPTASSIAMLVNPGNPGFAEADAKEAQEAARALGVNLLVLKASNSSEIDATFAALVQQQAGALLISGDVFYISRTDQLVALAARHAVPTIYAYLEQGAAGGLMCYGAGLAATQHTVGVYTGRILKGEKPADIPVEQVTKLQLVINMKTAKALGLTFPLSLLGRADEVIE